MSIDSLALAPSELHAMRPVRHRPCVLRPEPFSIQSSRLRRQFPFPSCDLPKSGSGSGADANEQLVPGSETSESSVADGAIGVRNPSSAPAIYYATPPQYPPIAGVRAKENGITHNLMTYFVDMSNPQGFGAVMSLEELMTWVVASREINV